MAETELYTAAGNILRIAMGKVKVGRGRKARLEWKADQDPLALVCGIEAILSLVQKEGVAR